MEKYYVTCARMKILEKNTDLAGLSYYEMMENAGRIAANRIVEITAASPINDAKSGRGGSVYPWNLGRAVRARVYCGKGNNGGDGFVVARLLHEQGWDVEMCLVDGEPATEDAITNYEKAKALKIPVREPADAEPADPADPAAEANGRSDGEAAPDVVVDAIYGTGFHGQLRSRGARAAAEIAEARRQGSRVFALDIPSGMGGDVTDESELDQRCVRADVTITFHAKKPVHLQDFAKEYCGQIITADIGIVDEDAPGDVGLRGTGREDAPGDNSLCGTGREDAPGETGCCRTENKEGSFDEFVEIVAKLRAPDGCPWDRAQTHETLKKYLKEETEEALEAIDKQDDDNFCEELGDVLLQIVLHAQIASETDRFDIGDVIRGISDKMIRRHPWVFGDMKVSTPEEGEKLWEEIKKKEKEKGLK